MCRKPVGDGAKRVRIMVNGQERKGFIVKDEDEKAFSNSGMSLKGELGVG
jgi:hypothetical protein